MIDLQIKRLVDYGVNKGLIGEADRIWATNEILDALHLSEYTEPDCKADSADPVSYTHLDVYKRQEHMDRRHEEPARDE